MPEVLYVPNRLDFLKSQISAFEGSMNPSKAIELGYYVTEPRKSVSELIAKRLALRPASTHLLLGGIGSGKTTQLLRTFDRVNELLENTYVRYIDVSLYTDISKISPKVLITIVGLTLANLMSEEEDTAVKKNIEFIQRFAYGYSEVIKTPDKIKRTEILTDKIFEVHYNSNLQDIIHSMSHADSVRHFHHPGVLVPKNEQQRDKLTTAVNELYQSVVRKDKENKQMVFLFDGLDRLDDSKSFSYMIANDLREMSLIGIGSVVIGSARTLYEELKDTIEKSVDFIYLQSCLDIQNDREAHDFFTSILKKRASENFLSSEVTESLIRYSGGVLRDLMSITQSSIEELYLSDDEDLMLTHVEKAAESFGRSRLLGLTENDIDTLRNFAAGKSLFPASDAEIKLMVTGRIIEYMHPKRRCIIHPSLLTVLTPVTA
jgi:Cdc6-like AAA superfamily ATPase